MTCLHWGDLTREQISAVAGHAVAVLPVGAVEQHGPHLPTKTDAFVAANVARAASEQVPAAVTALVLPAMPFGYSAHHVPFGGTLSLSGQVLAATLTDLLRSVRRAGLERALLVNGHGGNVEICGMVAKQAAIELDMAVAAVSYWTTLDTGTDVPGHAGSFETSLMLHLAPELVVRDRFSRSGGSLLTTGHPGVVVEDPRHWDALGGWTDDPADAEPDRGARCFAAAADAIADIVAQLADQRTVRGAGTPPPN